LRNAVEGLASALEAHLEEEAVSSSLLSATALRAPHQANAVDHTRRRSYDLCARGPSAPWPRGGDARSFEESRHVAQMLAADVGKRAAQRVRA
jgi:hypothetical protein